MLILEFAATVEKMSTSVISAGLFVDSFVLFVYLFVSPFYVWGINLAKFIFTVTFSDSSIYPYCYSTMHSLFLFCVFAKRMLINVPNSLL